METKFTKEKFIEPTPIKAGDLRVKLGVYEKSPLVDCRVISESNYQLLKEAYDLVPELLEALTDLWMHVKLNNIDALNETYSNDSVFSKVNHAIKKATE